MVRVHFGPPLRKAKVKSKSEKWRSNLFTVHYYLLLQIYGGLAQLGERLPCKQEVTGSIPVLSTNKFERLIEAPRNWCFTESLETRKEYFIIQHFALSILHLWSMNAPWKLNIEVIMMQLWEQQLREIYNWVIIQFCKYLLKWVCIILLIIENQIGLFLIGWTEWNGRTNPGKRGQANKSARGMPWH